MSAEPKDEAAHPTFDPIGSLLLGVTVPSCGSARVRLLIGLAADKSGDVQRYYYIEYRTPVGLEKTKGVIVHYSADIKQGATSVPTEDGNFVIGGARVKF